MPRGARAKKKNRRRQAAEGLGYRRARRERIAASPTVPGVPARTDAPGDVGMPVSDRLVAEAIESLCADLLGEDLEAPEFSSTWGVLPVPEGLESPLVHELIPDLSSVESQLDEVLEGGTELHTVHEIPATLIVEGVMPKSVAFAAADNGDVSILDEDHNDHYASVMVSKPVEVEMSIAATINPDAESVADVQLSDMAVAR